MTDNTEFVNKVITSFKNIFETEDAEDVRAKPAAPQASPVMPTIINASPYGFRFAEKRREDHPYLAPVNPTSSFKLKTDHGNVVAEVMALEALCSELKRAPDEAVIFHMSRGNDFSAWVKDAIGDWYLGSRIEKVNFENPAIARSQIVQLLEERINKLRNH